MKLFVEALFYLFFILVVVGVYAESSVMMPALRKHHNENLRLAFRQKTRLRYLDMYLNLCRSNKASQFWYRYLNIAYKYGIWFVIIWLVLAVIAIAPAFIRAFAAS